MRASGENGGVLISPLSHTNGRDCVATAHAYIRSDIAARGLERSRFPEPRDVGLKGTKVGRLPASCEQGAAGRDREDGVNSVAHSAQLATAVEAELLVRQQQEADEKCLRPPRA